MPSAPSETFLLPRVFVLYRRIDETGVSGTGIVAHGVQWTDGTVAVRWLGENPSTVIWDNIDKAMAVHGHDGKTVVVWGPGLVRAMAPPSPYASNGAGS
jgi:D-hexose-6-phosphate mutarotase